MNTNYSNVKVYQALKRNFINDLRFVSLNRIYNEHPNIRNRRIFVINNQMDELYYPDTHFFSRQITKLLKKHNYVNTIRTLEDIKVLSESFTKYDPAPKDLNYWFSVIYNLRTPRDEGGEPVKETLSNIKLQVSKIL